MRAVVALAIAAAGLTPATLQAQTTVLEPSSKWHLDYADASCRLGRTFGEGDQKTVLFLDQHEPSRSFAWTVAGKPVERFSEQREPEVRFGTLPPVQRDRDQSGILGGELKGFGAALIGAGHKQELPFDAQKEIATPGLSQLDLGDGSQVTWIELARGDKRRLRLNTGSMKGAFEALNRCTGDLVKAWGLDLEQQQARSSRPDWINKDAVARQLRYPATALRAGNRARLNMRIMVDANGKPTQCVLTKVTLADAFNEAACQQVMRSARFIPARGADGRPIASYYSTDIVYVIG